MYKQQFEFTSCNVYEEIGNTLKDTNTRCKILHRHVPDTSMTVFCRRLQPRASSKKGLASKEEIWLSQSSALDNPSAYKIHNGVSTMNEPRTHPGYSLYIYYIHKSKSLHLLDFELPSKSKISLLLEKNNIKISKIRTVKYKH